MTPYAARVLAVVDRIPPGKVLTYGDVREYVGGASARAVGAVLARHGHEVPWHRVVLASGGCAAHDGWDQLARLRAEGVPLLAAGTAVDLARARWDGGEPSAGEEEEPA